MDMLPFLALAAVPCIALGAIPAMIAANKGLNVWAWWIVGACFPLVAVLLVLLTPGRTRPCKHCGAQMPFDVTLCRRCGGRIPRRVPVVR